MKLKLALLGLLNAFLLLGYVWCRLQTYDIGYEISRSLDELQSTRDLNSRLRLEYSQLSSPSRIRDLAENRLGLKPLRPAQRVVLEVPVGG